MLLHSVSLSLKLSSGDPQIPFSLLGSCLSQPRWHKADGRKSIHQAWKLCLVVGTAALEATALTLGATSHPPLVFPWWKCTVYGHQTIPWLVSVCAHRSRHHPSVVVVLATSALTISGLAGTKQHVLTARRNGFSSRQMALLPRHLPDGETLTVPPPRLSNVIRRPAWVCQGNTGALSYLNSRTVPLCGALLTVHDGPRLCDMTCAFNGITWL